MIGAMGARTGQVLDEYQRPVPGASIYVYKQDGTDATLTSDGTAALGQPVTTDEFGTYSYYATDAKYREDTWYGGKLRYREVVAVGSAGVAAHQTNSTATDVAGIKGDFNALLAKLQAAGLMA